LKIKYVNEKLNLQSMKFVHVIFNNSDSTSEEAVCLITTNADQVRLLKKIMYYDSVVS
jgi:hypothetical protein